MCVLDHIWRNDRLVRDHIITNNTTNHSGDRICISDVGNWIGLPKPAESM